MGSDTCSTEYNYDYQSEALQENYYSTQDSYTSYKDQEKPSDEIEKPDTEKSTDTSPSIPETETKEEDSKIEKTKNIDILSEKIKEVFYDSNNSSSFSTQCSSSSLLENLVIPYNKTKSLDVNMNKTKNTNKNILSNRSSTNKDIRKNFMTQLIYRNIWKKDKTHNSLIIFDWDDTLLPTSYLQSLKLMNVDTLPDSEKEKLQNLENKVINILNLALSKGEVYIITNSCMGWVEHSAAKFYPNLGPIIEKVKIISARTRYEDMYPGNGLEWKVQCFLNLKENINNKLVTNIICIGDSAFEMEAGKILASTFTEAFIKSIKFREGPRPSELCKQIKLVTDEFNYIYSSVKNLNIKVGKKCRNE